MTRFMCSKSLLLVVVSLSTECFFGWSPIRDFVVYKRFAKFAQVCVTSFLIREFACCLRQICASAISLFCGFPFHVRLTGMNRCQLRGCLYPKCPWKEASIRWHMMKSNSNSGEKGGDYVEKIQTLRNIRRRWQRQYSWSFYTWT